MTNEINTNKERYILSLDGTIVMKGVMGAYYKETIESGTGG